MHLAEFRKYFVNKRLDKIVNAGDPVYVRVHMRFESFQKIITPRLQPRVFSLKLHNSAEQFTLKFDQPVEQLLAAWRAHDATVVSIKLVVGI